MSSYNDDYLLMLVMENNDEAIEEFYEKYNKVVFYKAYKYKYIGSKLGLELDDLIQEGNIGLSQAITDYAKGSNASFNTFANLCIEREIQSSIIKASRKKHAILNESISLEQELTDGKEILSIIPSKQKSVDEVVFDTISEEAELQVLFKHLTDFERDVFDLKYVGYDYRQISLLLNRDLKAVDNAIQRIKRKVKKLFD